MPPGGHVSDNNTQPHGNVKIQGSWWPGWIWGVPAAAAIILGWLGIRVLTNSGDNITITFNDVHGLSNNGAISYRGLDVGHVTKIVLADDGHTVDVSATIDRSASHFVRSGTRFWLRNAAPSLSNLSSLGAVLSGPGLVMDPGPGDKASQFGGLTHQPIAPSKNSQPQSYDLSFDGSVGALAPGDAVKLRGFTVGEIRTVGFTFDASSNVLSTPVTIDLYPSLFHVQGGNSPNSPAALRSLVDKMVDNGLRAKLDREPPLIGAYRVVLDVEQGLSPPPHMAGARPQIPTSSAGGLSTIVDQLNGVPIGEIANHVLGLVRHADALASSPDLRNAIIQLDDALKQANEAAKQVNATAASAGPKITTLVETLGRAARKLDQTAASADRAANSANAVIDGTTSQYGIESATREITQAARAVRELADFLNRHPEALIRGRPGGE